MADSKTWSLGAFAAYGKSTATPAANFQHAFVQDAKKFYAKAGYPSKDEIGILDTITPDVTNTCGAIPELVAGFIHDEKRPFKLPAPDNKSTSATIKLVHVDEKKSEGETKFGDKVQKWTSVVKAHDEYKVKNNRDDFKK